MVPFVNDGIYIYINLGSIKEGHSIQIKRILLISTKRLRKNVIEFITQDWTYVYC